MIAIDPCATGAQIDRFGESRLEAVTLNHETASAQRQNAKSADFCVHSGVTRPEHKSLDHDAIPLKSANVSVDGYERLGEIRHAYERWRGR
jgi:hypothetical protein